MQLVFTKTIGRYSEGEIKDFPLATWNQIATSAKAKLESFTITPEALAKRSTKGANVNVKR